MQADDSGRNGDGDPEHPVEHQAIDPQLYARLSRHLLESVAVVNASGSITAVLGPPEGALGIGQVVGRHIFEYCAEDDLPRALELAVDALASAPGWSATWMVHLNGSRGREEFELHIENCQDEPLLDGFVVRLRQLPARDAATEPLFRSELGQEMETLAGAVPLPIVFIGPDSRIYFVNDAMREFCGPALEHLERDGFTALAVKEDRAVLGAVLATLGEGPGEQTVRFRMDVTPQGRVVEARISALGQAGRVLALVASLVDVTARHREESELRRRASSDALTGVPNRNELEAGLSERLVLAPERVGLLYIDLDGFKNVNDTFGHDVGDGLLIEVARVLTEGLGAGDLVARIGGDEFAVVIDSLDATAVGRLALRLGEAIATTASGRGLSVTASIGAAFGAPGSTARDLLRHADRAMYDAKRRKRRARLST